LPRPAFDENPRRISEKLFRSGGQKRRGLGEISFFIVLLYLFIFV